MRCGACANENRDGRKFCTACGSPLALACPSCGASYESGEKFCGDCGAELTAVAPSPPPKPAAPRAPARPKHLADRIRQARPALEGERKHITVLFADVKGSMTLAERFDPEQWFRIVEDFFQVAADGVHRFEGTVNQFTGDGMMALFGAPIAHEDHAQRACLAALHMRDAVRTFAEDVLARHGVRFDIRIGLNSGEVMIGRISDDLSMDYTAIGHDVGLAQRMESLAEIGQICLSEHTARLVEGYFELRDRGRIQVKGVIDPIGLFDLEGVGTFRTRLDRSRARGLSAFVGRAHDTALLEAALDRARTGGQVLGIMAEAGAGKSRLCAEFLDGCRARGLPVLEGHGVAHGKAIPMLPILQLWRAYYAIEEADNPDITRAKISEKLLSMDTSYRDDLPIIFDLFGVPDPANPAPVMDPEQRQKRLHNVVKRVLRDPAHRAAGTRVLVLEDLHWFDGASDAFLDTTVESIPASHDLLLVNFRPEYQARWMQRSYYQHLPLQPLTSGAIQDLLRDHLGQDVSVASLAEVIQRRTKGNPFFIEEVLQSLIESGHLAGARGAYRLTAQVTNVDVPASVQAVLASRIDRLSEQEKQVLQTAAVIGKQFSEMLLRKVLASVASLDDAALEQTVAALIAAEFLHEASVWPWVEYSFKHPLTQEVAQRSQLRARQIRVHAAVAQALEDAGGNLDERAAEIAQHWAEAEEIGRAARWHRRAAIWAGLSDPREGLRNWRRARELAAGIHEWDERTSLLLQACQQLLAIGWRLGGNEQEYQSAFAEGRALAEQIGDIPALACLVASYGGLREHVGGSASDGVRYSEEAFSIVDQHGDRALRAAITTHAMYGRFWTGEGHACLAWSDRALADTGEDALLGKTVFGFSPLAAALQARPVALLYLGRIEDARRAAVEATRLAEACGELEVLTWVHAASAWVAYAAGGPGPVLETAHRCLELAETLDNDNSRAWAYLALGMAHLIDAQFTEAVEALRAGAAIALSRVSLNLLPQILAVLAEAHLACGESAEALAAAQEAIDRGRDGGCRYFEASAQIALAGILITADGPIPHAKIEAALARAEKLVAAVEGRSLSPRILELRGRLADAFGDAPGAGKALRDALDLYREIGAAGHAERLAPVIQPLSPRESRHDV